MGWVGSGRGDLAAAGAGTVTGGGHASHLRTGGGGHPGLCLGGVADAARAAAPAVAAPRASQRPAAFGPHRGGAGALHSPLRVALGGVPAAVAGDPTLAHAAGDLQSGHSGHFHQLYRRLYLAAGLCPAAAAPAYRGDLSPGAPCFVLWCRRRDTRGPGAGRSGGKRGACSFGRSGCAAGSLSASRRSPGCRQRPPPGWGWASSTYWPAFPGASLPWPGRWWPGSWAGPGHHGETMGLYNAVQGAARIVGAVLKRLPRPARWLRQRPLCSPPFSCCRPWSCWPACPCQPLRQTRPRPAAKAAGHTA
ncbi:MAG: hypothetical protein KatS3mg131_1455 [Candidatus Tectimicrobiota bacterium]|nr:MAG: hypothetical protein KatS3mg131_1455 [Candidatus Tectomicrobia bacterium]